MKIIRFLIDYQLNRLDVRLLFNIQGESNTKAAIS